MAYFKWSILRRVIFTAIASSNRPHIMIRRFLLLSLHDHFSFNRASFASEVTPTAARACSTVTSEFHEKIGCTVYDLRHFSESRCNVHIADQFYEPFHAIEVTSADLIITR